MSFMIGCSSGAGGLKSIVIPNFIKKEVIPADIIRKHLTKNDYKLEVTLPLIAVRDPVWKGQPYGVMMLQLGEYYYYVEFFPKARGKSEYYYRTNINAAPADEVPIPPRISISETALGPFTLTVDNVTSHQPKAVFTFPKDILTRYPFMSLTFSKQNIKPLETPLPIDNRSGATPPSFALEDLLAMNGDNRSVYIFDFIENILGGRSGFSLSFTMNSPRSVGNHIVAKNTLAILPINKGRYYSPQKATVKINGENGPIVPPNTEMPRNASYYIHKQFEDYPEAEVYVTIESYRNSSRMNVSRVTFRFRFSLDLNRGRDMKLFMINNIT